MLASHPLIESKNQRTQKQFVIAVIDTGADVDHAALKPYLWKNPGESGQGKESNGIDDDGNGLVDDVHGWNFANNSNDLSDAHGHGTHISGIIAGLAPPFTQPHPAIKVMILKYHSPSKQNPTIDATVAAIHYATSMGAKVINYSSGGYIPSRKEYQALQLAKTKGVLVFAAAGNDRQDSDLKPYYPANYSLKNVISVASLSSQKKLSNFSNDGEHSTKIRAFGENIYSTLPGGRYGSMSGTSQATATASHHYAWAKLHQIPKQKRKIAQSSTTTSEILNFESKTPIRTLTSKTFYNSTYKRWTSSIEINPNYSLQKKKA